MPRRQRRRRLSAVSLNTSFNADATPARQSSVEPSDVEVSFIDIGQNDDNLERSKARKSRSRRKSMGAGMAMGMITPVHSARRGSIRSRRSQSPHSGGLGSSNRKKRVYTNEQLSQIYKDCIVKAQQGKINQQNAWNLKLVDNIKEITDLNTNNKENDGDHNNNRNNRNNRNKKNDASFEAFARASHTIDAASKIYGYRVDSVHNKTYKVLGSIHQQNEGGDGDGLNGDEQNEKKRKRQQRNRNVGRSTLCDMDKIHKLNETMKNLCVEVDPLFHKTASCFDEGGAKGLLMNTLYVQNGCDIVFDSNTKIEQNEDITNQGVVINNEVIENEEEIEKENEWLTQLFTDSFGKEVDGAFDGFTQIDTTSPDFDVSTQTKPQNFVIDMEWIKNCSVCPLIEVFQHNITNITKKIPDDLDQDGNGSQNNSGINDKSTPEKDLNNGGNVNMFDNDNGYPEDDDDVIMDMPDFTIGGGQDLNAQDLFHEELLTQAHAPSNMQPRSLLMVNGSNMGNINGSDLNNVTIQNISNLQLDPNGMPINGNNIEYVLGQHGDNIGNMGVQPLLNNSLHFQMDNDQVLNNLQLEQEQHGAIHQKGIYKRGTMNITAMNQVISKLENADFESLTSFFDTKKHGNWAGPDQWYHRRYQMITQSNNKKSRSPSRNAAGARTGSVANENEEEKSEQSPRNKRRKRGERKSTRFDFLSIANGNLIDESEFVEPPKSKNILSQAVLAKNMKSYHTLPKDLQIKPDMFIKLFHRPNYSVWKHWLRQHQLRMMKLRKDAAQQQQQANADGDGDAAQQQQGMEGVSFADAMGMGDDGDAYQMNVSIMQREELANIKAAQDAVLLDNDNSNDAFQDEFQYNYNNALDQSHFVPDLLGINQLNNDQEDDGNNNYFNFQLNGYDLIEIDASKKLEKIKVEFATSAKKVNVRKLKLKLWDKIYTDLPSKDEDNQEQESKDSAKENNNVDTDDDIDMDDNNKKEEQPKEEEEEKTKIKKTVTFQDTLDTLPSTISSSISIHMCFICLLHLANEKELQFVPNMNEEDKDKDGDDSFKLDRGNFEIEYASENSQFEKDAMKINPIAVLGMQ